MDSVKKEVRNPASKLQHKFETRLAAEIEGELSWKWFHAQFVLGKTKQLSRVQCPDGNERQLLSMMHGNYLGSFIAINYTFYTSII